MTDRMLAIGMKLHGARFHVGDKVVASLGFDELPGAYPFLLALSQSVTERLLREAVATAGR